jgi:ATP-dependent exoDNAse (exonuclease V) beta subunit
VQEQLFRDTSIKAQIQYSFKDIFLLFRNRRRLEFVLNMLAAQPVDVYVEGQISVSQHMMLLNTDLTLTSFSSIPYF